jgi:hypothetical protein
MDTGGVSTEEKELEFDLKQQQQCAEHLLLSRDS